MTGNMREAAQQALEAMESVEWYGAGSGWMVDADAIEGAITALRAALAEPVQEPVMYSRDALDAAVAAEREACAAICDTTPPYPFRPSIEAAHAIRARGLA